jgi:peptidoglycan hydrolase CwlO-like protein
MSSKWFWLILIAVILFSAIFLWHNHTSTQETLIKAQETIKETKQALRENQDALQKIDEITQKLQDVTRMAKKAGDKRVEEIKYVSDDDFLNIANQYSALMVERVE